MAFNHVLVIYPNCPGVISLDADGQHLPSDAARVADAFQSNTGIFYLGIRFFASDRTPWRSWLGNRISQFVFGWISGWPLRDTQTGLRAIPSGLMRDSLRLKSNGYEFERTCYFKQAEAGIRIKK